MKKAAPTRKRLTILEETRLNQRVARRLARQMAETHNGQWVALRQGEVVAIEPTLDALVEKFAALEPDPRRGMVFQVGEDYRKKKIILSLAR